MTCECAGRVDRLEAELAELRAAAAAPDGPHNPIRWRRTMLQRLWRGFYGGMTRSGAANAMAQDWAEVSSRHRDRHEPGTAAALFAELTAQGVRPLSARAIREELIPSTR